MDTILSLDPNNRLIYGARRGYNGVVKSALQGGADVRANYNSALRSAVENALGPGAKTHTETDKLLLDRGADINAWNDEALRNAAMRGRIEMVKILLDRGAKIHTMNDAALYLAVLRGHPETVKSLLAYGATMTPGIRRLVEQRGNPEIIDLLE